MDVNDVVSISSSVNLDSVQNQLIDKSKSANQVKELDKDDALKLSISSVYNKKRDELSLTLQSLNEGIAITQISIDGLTNQQKSLKTIETSLIRLETSGDYESNRYDTASEISGELNNFIEEAQNATYKKRYLLDDQYGDNVMTIITSNKNYELKGLNTKEISQNIYSSLQDNQLSSTNDVLNAVNVVREGEAKLDEYLNSYKEMQNEIKLSARSTINDQINLMKENSKVKDSNFGNNSTDFNKTSITSNLGYLAASQANIIQEQSVKLLS